MIQVIAAPDCQCFTGPGQDERPELRCILSVQNGIEVSSRKVVLDEIRVVCFYPKPIQAMTTIERKHLADQFQKTSSV